MSEQKFEYETRKSPCPCGQSSDGFQYVKGSRVGGKCHSDKCGQKFTPPTDLNNTATHTNGKHYGSTPRKTIAAEYDYHNERGELVHQTVRYENPKEFKQRRPDPHGGWIWKLDDIVRVLYRLPELICAVKEGRTVYIPEGEKDANSLISRGFAATTNAMGAGSPKEDVFGNWKPYYNEYLRGSDVVILADKDGYFGKDGKKSPIPFKGERFALYKAREISQTAARVSIIEFDDCKDVTEFFERGGETFPNAYSISEYAEHLNVCLQSAQNLEMQAETETSTERANTSENTSKNTSKSTSKNDEKPAKKTDGNKAERALKMILNHDTGDMLFTDSEGTEYIRYGYGGYVQTLRIRSQAFGEMVQHEFYERYKSVLGGQTLADVKSALAGRAKMLGRVRPVWRRVASYTNPASEHQREVWIDLTNAEWQALRITSHGWSVEASSKPLFIRSKHDVPLPVPVPERTNGSTRAAFDRLRKYCNVSDDDFMLLVAFIVGAWNPNGAYPMLQLHAQHGAGKSTLTRVLKRLIDPQKALIRSLPRDEESLMMNAQHSWLLAYDNVSDGIAAWLSDALCRVTTGGTISRRTLHMNDEETIFSAKRPVVLNGIDATTIERPDLQDRTLRIELLPINDGSRRTEQAVEEEFAQDYPHIIGAICDAVQSALCRYDMWAKRIERDLPRMADFTLWACAALDGVGFDAERLLSYYAETKRSLLEDAAETNIITETLLRYMEHRRATLGITEYNATSTEVLNALVSFIEKEGNRVPKDFPKSSIRLSRQLERLKLPLNAKGLSCERNRTTSAIRARFFA